MNRGSIKLWGACLFRHCRFEIQYSVFLDVRERTLRSVAKNLAVTVLAGSLGACSIYLPISPLSEDSEITGSITKSASPKSVSPLSPKLNEEDWRRAQSALVLAVDPQGNGAAVGWDNPESGTKGSFVASGALFLIENRVCRPFKASLNKPEPETLLQGTSCRLGPNEWVVRDVQAASTSE